MVAKDNTHCLHTWRRLGKVYDITEGSTLKGGDQDRIDLRMNNMRSLLLPALLLCSLYVAKIQTQENTNTLKLCGRAFVRAVVYTCGGSRWRRLTGDEDLLDSREYESHSSINFDVKDLTYVQINCWLFLAGSRESKLMTTFGSVMERSQRDQNQALISVCCSLGCRKSDLSRLC